MEKLLYIEASPRKTRSSSIEIAKEFLDEYQKIHLQDELAIVDLWQEQLPEFDKDTIDAKYAIMHGKPHSEAQMNAWKRIEEIIAKFRDADKYVFSLPMWNFGIPYKLKHYIDILVQPTYTFEVTQEGYKGLVANKKALLVYSRGGAYEPNTEAEKLDLQKPYMETILGFIGFQDFTSIVIEPTLESDEKKEQALHAAKQQIQKIASLF
ncbi:MAG: NAD(P)H-dependent oxidoreductase [Waddliaceae bacterium]